MKKPPQKPPQKPKRVRKPRDQLYIRREPTNPKQFVIHSGTDMGAIWFHQSHARRLAAWLTKFANWAEAKERK